MNQNSSAVKAYLEKLPEDRRAAMSAVRDVINKNLPKGYEEGIQYNMIGWFVPHSIYPAGYHCNPKEPLPFISLASQKNHMAAYMFCLYMDPAEIERFEARWAESGKKLDMGKSCVRFKNLEGVCLEAIGEAVKRMPVKKFVEQYESQYGAAQARNAAKKKAAAKKTAKKTGAKKTAKKTAAKTVAKKATGKKTTKKSPGKGG
jgi:hypothetical protein